VDFRYWHKADLISRALDSAFMVNRIAAAGVANAARSQSRKPHRGIFRPQIQHPKTLWPGHPNKTCLYASARIG
jgi:hypothetical protein